MTSDIALFANRRDFMKTAVAGAGAVLGTGLAAESVRAAEPPQRIGPSHMKLSLAAYSFNRFLSNRFRSPNSNAKMTLLDFVDFCAEINLDGCELTGYYFPREITHEYLMHLKDKTFRLGLDISGTAIGNDFCLPEGEAREQQLSMCREWIDYAAVMGAPVIRIFAGKIPKGGTEEEAVERCVEGINQSLDYAAQKGVHLALENHGGITATPKQMLNIIKGVKKSPWFGVNFDSGNFRSADPYGDLEKIAPYTINAQIKATVTRNGKKEPADFKRTIHILKEAGYRGWVVLEYEERDDPKKAIPEIINQLRELI
ncbi:MAG: TIM barrel protein [Planctomycetes bacterium]|nr:TIM barrel protein [Planctomycetota bacterium]